MLTAVSVTNSERLGGHNDSGGESIQSADRLDTHGGGQTPYTHTIGRLRTAVRFAEETNVLIGDRSP